MKKILVITTLIGFLFTQSSCTNDDLLSELETNSTIENGKQPTKRAVENKIYSSLGVSYDVTNEYLGFNATKYPVIDIEAFLKKWPNSFVVDNATSSDIKIYGGADAFDFSKEIITQNISSNSFTGIDNVVPSSNLKFTSELNKTETYSSKYSYARADVIQRINRVKLNATPDMLKDYLYPEFVRDLNLYSADQFVAMYGTHILLDVTNGGILRFSYRSEITQTTSKTEKKAIVNSGIKLSIETFGADINNEYSSTEITSLSKKNSNWRTNINYLGGTNSGLSFSFNTESGLTSTNFNLASWQSSINKDNAEIIAIEWTKTYPIYDFIANTTKKAQIKAAVEKYIKKNKIETVEVKPFYRLYHDGARNSFYTTSLEEVNYYINQWGFHLDNVSTHYVQGYLFAKQQTGTVPLYRLYHSGAYNHFYTTSLTEANTYINQWGYSFDNVLTDRIVGYVYPTSQTGTVALYRLYHSGAYNSFLTTSFNEANTYIGQWGYYYDSPNSKYAYILPYGE